MNKAFGPRVVLVMGVVLAAVPFGTDSLLAQSRRFKSDVDLIERKSKVMRRTKAMPLCVGERSARCRAPSAARLDAICV
jgi:hypothetical protein